MATSQPNSNIIVTTSTLSAQAAIQSSIINVINSESPSKSLTPVSMCKYGQELVQEIMQKTCDIFSCLKGMQLPLGQMNDRKNRLEESLHKVENLFQKLHFVYDSVCNMTKNLENKPLESYLTTRDKGQDVTPCTSDVRSDEELRIIEQIHSKNIELKELIDHMRIVLWDIDTMMSLRRT